jgi:hypothetical protein
VTDADHHDIAEQLLDRAMEHDAGSDLERLYVASAQVHALLALAAAVAARS